MSAAWNGSRVCLFSLEVLDIYYTNITTSENPIPFSPRSYVLSMGKPIQPYFSANSGKKKSNVRSSEGNCPSVLHDRSRVKIVIHFLAKDDAPCKIGLQQNLRGNHVILKPDNVHACIFLSAPSRRGAARKSDVTRHKNQIINTISLPPLSQVEKRQSISGIA